MGIEEVKKEILLDARKQARSIIKEGEDEYEAILSSAESKAREYMEKANKEAEYSASLYRQNSLAEANSSLKREKLDIERKIVDRVFAEVKESLSKLPSRKRESHLKAMLSKGGKEYTKVYCSQGDMHLLKKYHPLAADITGGLILENKEGEIRLDLSYESMLERIKQENMHEISKILFE